MVAEYCLGMYCAFVLLMPLALLLFLHPDLARDIMTGHVLPLLLWCPVLALGEALFLVTALCCLKRLIGHNPSDTTFRVGSVAHVRHELSYLMLRALFNNVCTHGLVETPFIRPVLRFGMGLRVAKGAEIDTSDWMSVDSIVLGEQSTVNGGAVIAVPVVTNGVMTVRTTSLGPSSHYHDLGMRFQAPSQPQMRRCAC